MNSPSRKPFAGFISLIGITAIFLGCTGVSSDKPAVDADTGGKTAKEILASLNVFTSTDTATQMTSALTDENGKFKEVTVNTEEWQPLKDTYTVFLPRAEVFQAGIDVNGAYANLFQDATYEGSPVFAGDQAWARDSFKTAVSLDLDGDGIDEIALLYVNPADLATLHLRVYKDGNASAGITVSGITLSGKAGSIYTPGRIGMGTPWYPYMSAAKGDTDGDGYDEILLRDDMTVYILDVEATGAACTVAARKTYGTSVSSVAAGDCDGDGIDEFAVCRLPESGSNDALFAVYDSGFEVPVTSPEFTVQKDALFGEACFGDFDGDHFDELCVASAYAGITADMYNIDQGTITKKNTIVNAINYLGGNPGSEDAYRLCPLAVDINGDGLDELHLECLVYNTPMSSSTDYWNAFEGWNGAHTGDWSIVNVAAGDVDCNETEGGVSDGREDLVFVSSAAYENSAATLQVIGLDSADGIVAKKSDLAIGTAARAAVSVALAVGNADNDSSRVKYSGHELKYTDPVVLAVLVSPPYYESIAGTDADYAGNYKNWTTYFGQSKTDGVNESASVGFSIGASLEYEQDLSVFGVKIGSVKASVAFTNNTKWEWNASYAITQSIQYNCAGGEDKVIFTSVPMDEYSYEVLHSTNPGDPAGSVLKIKIPRKFDTYMVTRDFYNANNGDLADIDSSVVAHTLGQPRTYPTEEDMIDALGEFGGYATENAHQASQADDNSTGGSTGLEIAVESGKEKTVSCDFDVTASAGAGAGGWIAVVSAGFSTGFSYSTSTAVGTKFGGTVGYLPTTYYNDSSYKYSSGLFVYPYEDERTLRKYWIVNYWVK